MRSATEATARHEVCSYDIYEEAQRAVDSLADRRFPVEQLAIVAHGIRLVENVTGRGGYANAAAGGAVSGGVIGALFGFLFGVFSWIDPIISGMALGLYGLMFGAAVGLALGLVTQWLSAGRRDFSSVRSLQAERFAVMAETVETAERARAELAQAR